MEAPSVPRLRGLPRVQGSGYCPIMEKPPPAPPERRWYHRFALVENSTDYGSLRFRILSWHVTRFAAAGCAVDLIMDQEAAGGTGAWMARDSVWWDVVPAGRAPQC